MCVTPCTLNLLQVICMRERKHHLQNLQQFQCKFEVEKQDPWTKIKTKTFYIDFDCKCPGLGKSKVMVHESQL